MTTTGKIKKNTENIFNVTFFLFSSHKTFLMKKLILLGLIILSAVTGLWGQDEEKKDLDIGNFIIGHVSDSYDWHITTIGHTHVSLPLPVILYSQEQGLVVFMSNKLHNETHSYQNFFISEEKDLYKGKIMERLSDEETVVRPFDISITKNVLALFISSIMLIWIFISTAKRYQRSPNEAPRGLQSLLEPLVIFIRDEIAKEELGEKADKYLPYLLTVFFFILLNNLMGMIPIFPGGYNLTGNIAVTMVLALFTFVITTFSGTGHYWKHIFWPPDVPWWLKAPLPLLPIIELVGVFTKPFVLMVRLFANIIGGHMVMLTFFSLIFIFGAMSVSVGLGVSVLSVALTIFDTLLELLVAFIQAYVFTLLSAIYFGMAIEKEH